MKLKPLTLFLTLAYGVSMAQTLVTHTPAYHLEYSDSLTVAFRYTPEFDQEITIGPDGSATIAGIGTIQGRGMTIEQFKAKLVELAAQHLADPAVAVTLKNFVKPHIYVGGEVNTPGRVDLREDISVLDAIALAGGFKQSGSKNNVLLLRQEPGSPNQTRVIDLTAFLKSHKLEEVPQMRAGDVLYVSATKFSKLEQIAHLGAFGAIYNPMR